MVSLNKQVLLTHCSLGNYAVTVFTENGLIIVREV